MNLIENKKSENCLVKKAEELTSLAQLTLSERTRNYLENHEIALPELVKLGRRLYFQFKVKPKSEVSEPKWRQELVQALDQAGFIRQDLFPRTYRVLELYSEIFDLEQNPVLGTKKYETCPSLTDQQFEQLQLLMREALTERKQSVLIQRYGLQGGEPLSFKEIGQQFGLSSERAKQLADVSVRALRRPKHLLRMAQLFDVRYGNPYINGENELIENINLASHTEIRLRCAGFRSVHDILSFPRSEWAKQRFLGRRGLKDLEWKIQNLGFFDFKIL